MNIGFLSHPLGGSPLLLSLRRAFQGLGHNVVDFPRNRKVDLVLVFNFASHQEFEYEDFPVVECPMAFIDSAEYGWWTHEKKYARWLYNAFAPAALMGGRIPGAPEVVLSSKGKQQFKLKKWLEGKSFPYFLREMYKDWNYPSCYHPIDYPLWVDSHCQKEPQLEEYLKRPLDFYVAWGNSHPYRAKLNELLAAQPRSQVYSAPPRIDQKFIFQQTEAAKSSISYHGYGHGSFRVMENSVRTLLFKCRTCIQEREPFVNGETCLEYDVWGSFEEMGTDLGEKLDIVRKEPERAFGIYKAGREHCLKHLTEEATARYVLGEIEKHDFTQPTPLVLTQFNQ